MPHFTNSTTAGFGAASVAREPFPQLQPDAVSNWTVPLQRHHVILQNRTCRAHFCGCTPFRAFLDMSQARQMAAIFASLTQENTTMPTKQTSLVRESFAQVLPIADQAAALLGDFPCRSARVCDGGWIKPSFSILHAGKLRGVRQTAYNPHWRFINASVRVCRALIRKSPSEQSKCSLPRHLPSS